VTSLSKSLLFIPAVNPSIQEFVDGYVNVKEIMDNEERFARKAKAVNQAYEDMTAAVELFEKV